jgi:hypothetical protein
MSNEETTQDEDIGTIYVLSNRAFPDRIKLEKPRLV